jgi:hypothetical protein
MSPVGLKSGMFNMCCIVCSDWEKGKLTLDEAWRNLGEIAWDEFNSEEERIHYLEVAEMLAEKKNEEFTP